MLTLLLTSLMAPTVDISIEGEGMMRFWHEDRVVYAKEASLTITDGSIVHVSGVELAPPIKIDSDSFTVSSDGSVKDAGGSVIGQLVAARFTEEPNGQGLFESDSVPRLGKFGEEGFGVVKSGAQTSFVKLHLDEPVSQPSQPVSESVTPPSAEFLAAGGVQITLNDLTEVDTDEYTLGQVATIYAKADLAAALANMSLGTTPPLGAHRLITIDRITNLLKIAGYEAERYRISGSHRPIVRRKGHTITHEELVAMAIEAARNTFGETSTFRQAAAEADLVVSQGEVELVAGEPRASGATLTIRVDVFVDGKKVTGRNVRLLNGSPIASIKTGSTIRVLVVAGAAIVETTGTVRRVDMANNQVTVSTPSGATLTGHINARGELEVQA